MRGRDVHGDPPQPGEERVVAFQLVQAAVGAQVAVLLDVPGQILVAGHGADAAVELGGGAVVELGESGLVAGLGLGNQRGKIFVHDVVGLGFHFVSSLFSVTGWIVSYFLVCVHSRFGSLGGLWAESCAARLPRVRARASGSASKLRAMNFRYSTAKLVSFGISSPPFAAFCLIDRKTSKKVDKI